MTSKSGRQGPADAEGDGREAAPARRPNGGVRERSLRGLGFDPVVAAAWLYYRDNLTQSDIAALLGVSRATVVNLLGESRRRGLVQVSIDEQHLKRVELARGLAERYGLGDCIIIPDDGGVSHPSDRIGEAGAQFLARELRSGDRLGVSFGRTVLAMSRAMPALALSDIEVIQITGSMTPKNAFSPELCTLNVATRIGGHRNSLHAPMFVSTAAVKDILMAEPALISHFELIRSCNRVIFGVADLASEGTIFESGMFQRSDIAPYIDKGAIAIIASHFIDIDGRRIPGQYDDKLIGMTLDELMATPQRICLSGGPDKVAALQAALTGGYVTHLVTDAPTAAALMMRYDGTGPSRG